MGIFSRRYSFSRSGNSSYLDLCFKATPKRQILALIYPDLYPDIIYQQQRGLNAIGAGGITGQGLFKGAYTQAGAVPESQNDMIFPLSVKNWDLSAV